MVVPQLKLSSQTLAHPDAVRNPTPIPCNPCQVGGKKPETLETVAYLIESKFFNLKTL